MRGPILILPDEIAERIAAGEVIERPAAVVRELLDNAIDADATEIGVELRGGGLELIRVADDGHGIPADEVELAFRRHATSKLRSLDDLAALRTLGFRGEALPSIAAVSEATLLTRETDAESGTLLVIRGGSVVRRARAARQPGTTVTVRHLFHTVPARLKFLTANRAESLLVGQLVRRYALAHPRLRLTLNVDGRASFRSTGSGASAAALAEVYGPSVAAALLPLPEQQSGSLRLSGFIGGRTATRPGRGAITLVVNGRLAASRGLLPALEAAYRPLLPRGRHPIALILLDVPPDEVDPNVHPAKAEVRLLREAEVAAALDAAVREALGRAADAPGATAHALGPTQYALPSPRRRIAEQPAAWGEADEQPLSPGLVRSLRVLAQVHEALILAEGPGGLYLVDQHRAHERVIYERLLREPGDPAAGGQALLEPLLIELSDAAAALLEARLAELEALGFACERFGGQTFLVRTIPPGANGDSAEELQATLEEALEDEDGWRERLLAALACRSAVRRHRPLGEAEMRRLVQELAETRAPAACPHGSPLILRFSAGFLERQFNW